MKKLATLTLSSLLFVSAHASALVIDIDATVNDQNNMISQYLDAGTYTVNVIDGQFQSWTAWNVSQLNCADVTGCVQTSPTTNTGWLTDYVIKSDYLTAISVDGVALTATNTTPQTLGSYFFSGTDTYFRYDDVMVYSTAAAALAAAETVTFTLSQGGYVQFGIKDTPITDNSGGLSLEVQEVPVPAAAWLFGSAILGLLTRKK